MTFHQRPSYFQTTQTELLRWDVQRLWQLAATLPVEHCPLSQFAAAFASVVWLGDSPPREGVAAPQPTLRALASYARDSYQADLAYPIILSAEGDVMDGRHRLVKAWMLSLPSIAAVRFPETPEPDQRRLKRPSRGT